MEAYLVRILSRYIPLILSRFGNIWAIVRNLGELSILSKASFSMLVFVPLLASLWPGVRWTLNRYDDFMGKSIADLRQVSAELEQLNSTTVQDPRINKIIEQMEGYVSNGPTSFGSSTMPEVWAVTFLAALAAVVAQLIYQMFAPTEVRNHSLSSFLADKRKQMKDIVDVNEIVDAVKNASISITEAAYLVMKYGTPVQEAAIEVFSSEELTDELVRLEEKGKKIDNDRLLATQSRLINDNAIFSYNRSGRSNLLASIFCLALYSVAVSFILSIVLNQTNAVLLEVGFYDSPGDDLDGPALYPPEKIEVLQFIKRQFI